MLLVLMIVHLKIEDVALSIPNYFKIVPFIVVVQCISMVLMTKYLIEPCSIAFSFRNQSIGFMFTVI